jgi:hypothetical protein
MVNVASTNVVLPTWLAIGDFNADGKPDFATADFVSGTGVAQGNTGVAINGGMGSFFAPVDYPTGDNAFGVVTADFDGDGRLDLALTNTNTDNFSVLLGNGNGTFQNAVQFPCGHLPRGIATADFNGDGKPDLVIANEGDTTANPPAPSRVDVFLNMSN